MKTKLDKGESLYMRVTMIVDNQKNNEKSMLKNENGMSMLIEKNNKKILFDTGKNGALIYNARQLDIDLKEVDIVIISHAHKNHSGGLLKFLELNRKAKIYLKPEALGEYGVQLGWFTIDSSIHKKVFTKYVERIEFVEKEVEVIEDLYIVSNILNTYPWPRVRLNQIKRIHGSIEIDDYKHELFLVNKEKEKTIIITGCSHNGVISMIETSNKLFPRSKVQAIIGGMHLNGINLFNMYSESKEEVLRIGNCLKRYEIEKIYTCHCTGIKQYKILKEILGEHIEYFNIGMSIEF